MLDGLCDRDLTMTNGILATTDQGVLTAEDQRGLTALFWAHVRPYGDITLNMTNRLAIRQADSRAPPTNRAVEPRFGASRTNLLLVTWCHAPYRHPMSSGRSS